MHMEQSVTRGFADFVRKTEFSRLPMEAVEQAKDYILDCVGCTVAGYAVPEGVVVAGLAKEFGSGTATILPSGQKTSTAGAAFVNGKLANVIDADETLYNYFHVGGVPLHAALSTAEEVGVGGRELIAATVLGYEFSFRFCHNYTLLAIGDDGRTTAARTAGFGFNTIAAAVAASRVLGLDIEGIRNAIGIAGYYVSLPLCNKWLYSKPWGMQKYQDFGWFCHAGTLAALFARDGYTGDRFLLDDFGERSFWAAFGMPGFDFEGMIKDLGEQWGIMNAGIKPYPACRWYSTPIHMLQQIMKENELGADDIRSIRVTVPPVVVSAYGEPGHWPEWGFKDGTHSQYSVSYNLACAALNIPVGPQWQMPDNLSRKEVVDFCRKISFAVDDKCEDKMTAYLKSGQPKGKLMTQVHYTLEVESSKGTFGDAAEYIYGDTYDREHALSREELIRKFKGNCSSVLSPNIVEKVVEAVYHLEECGRISDFTRLFS